MVNSWFLKSGSLIKKVFKMLVITISSMTNTYLIYVCTAPLHEGINYCFIHLLQNFD